MVPFWKKSKARVQRTNESPALKDAVDIAEKNKGRPLSQEEYDHFVKRVSDLHKTELDLIQAKVDHVKERISELHSDLGAWLYGIIVDPALSESDRNDKIIQVIREERDLEDPESALSVSKELAAQNEEIRAELDRVLVEHEAPEESTE